MAHVARSAQSSSPPGGTEALSPATEGHASCPAPHPLPAAAGPTGHTGSPLNGSPSATAACRPERTGLAQGLLGHLPAPHFWPPLHLPQLCTRPAPARQSLLAHPPRVCSQTPTLLLTLVGGGIPSPPPPQPSPPTALLQTQRLLRAQPSSLGARVLCRLTPTLHPFVCPPYSQAS